MFEYSDDISNDNGNVELGRHVTIDEFILFLMVMKNEKGFEYIALTTYDEQIDLNESDGAFDIEVKPQIKLLT